MLVNASTILFACGVLIVYVWLLCYLELREAVIAMGNIGVDLESAIWQRSMLVVWRKLDPKFKNIRTFFGAFGPAIIAVTALLMLIYAYSAYRIS